MCTTDEMEKCVENICYNEDDLYDIELYQICHDICHQKKLSKDQIIHICFIDDEKKHNIIVLMNLYKT
jgi:hypothetical protein